MIYPHRNGVEMNVKQMLCIDCAHTTADQSSFDNLAQIFNEIGTLADPAIDFADADFAAGNLQIDHAPISEAEQPFSPTPF